MNNNEGPVLPVIATGLQRRTSQRLLGNPPNIPNGIRQRRHSRNTKASPTQKQVLFMLTGRIDKSNATNTIQNKETRDIANSALQLSQETNAMMRASLEAQLGQVESQARIENSTNRLETGQAALTVIAKRVNAGVKGLVKTTDQILGITQRTERLVKTLKVNGVSSAIKELLLDEWVIFYLYFVLHPLAPASTEICAAVWKFALIANRTLNIRKDFKEGNLVPFSLSSIPGIYFTSPWKAIFLLHWYNVKFQSMHGTANYTELFPGGLDNAFGAMGSIFMEFFSSLRSLDINALKSMASTGISMSSEKIQECISSFFTKYPEALDAVTEACPTFASDKTAFFNCLGDYVLGKGKLVIDGAIHYLAAPGYIFQASEYIDIETNVIFWVASLIWDLIKKLFGKLLDTMFIGIELMMCAMKIPATTWTPEVSIGKMVGYTCKTKMEGGSNEDIDLLDSALAFSSFSLFMAYSVNYLTNDELQISRQLLKNQEDIVRALVKLESSNKIMMSDNILLLEDRKNNRQIFNIKSSNNTRKKLKIN